jgi:hypothetical protein
MKDESYELSLRFKQGDEFGQHLSDTASVSAALESSAQTLDSNATQCRELAVLLKDKNIEVQADAHMICFDGDKQVLNRAVKLGLLELMECEH